MNYLECSSVSPFTRTFIYFDKVPYYSNDIFVKNNIRVRIEPMEMDELKYHIIFAKVLRKDVDKFIKSMEELNRKMLLCGNPDYGFVCDDIINKVFKYIEKELPIKQLKK